jgi:translocation and assembly module TamB
MLRGITAFKIITGLLALPLLAILLLWTAANTPQGRQGIERMVRVLTQDQVLPTGLTGRFPDALRLERLELRDAEGVWLTLEDPRLDWSPSRLLTGTLAIQQVQAARVELRRLPAPEKSADDGEAFSMPLALRVDALRVDRLDVASAVAGSDASLEVHGSGRLTSVNQGELRLSVHRLDAEGEYVFSGTLDERTLRAKLTAREAAQGIAATLAGLPDLGPITLESALDGPLDAVDSRLSVEAGPLNLESAGTVDFTGETLDLAVAAQSGAMQPRPGVRWRAIDLKSRVQGPFLAPTVIGDLRMDAPSAGGVELARVTAKVRTDIPRLRLDATLEGLTAPGLHTDAPLMVAAELDLAAAEKPITFSMRHPWLNADGKATLGETPRGEMTIDLANLELLAAVGGPELTGHASLSARLEAIDDASRIGLRGTLSVQGGASPWPALLGEAATVELSADLRDGDITLNPSHLRGKTVNLEARGDYRETDVRLDWKLGLTDLNAITRALAGRVDVQGSLAGATEKLELSADLKGELQPEGYARAPVEAHLQLSDLPKAPAGALTARGILANAPLAVAVQLRQDSQGAVHMNIERGQWKSARLRGDLKLTPGRGLPIGKIELRIARLEDLHPWLKPPWSGALDASLDLSTVAGRPLARALIDARKLGQGAVSADSLHLALTVSDPLARPYLNGQLRLDGLAVGAESASARLDMEGPADALRLKLAATASTGADETLQTAADALLNAGRRDLLLSALRARWKGEALALLAPARIDFADGARIDALRLGIRKAELELGGRFAPDLDASLALRDLPLDLARLFVRDFPAEGKVSARARLAGTYARPTGEIEIEAKGLRLQGAPGRSLPAARWIARADLRGDRMNLETRLDAAPDIALNITGEAPLDTVGAMNLRAAGKVNLKLLDPVLTPGGRRARGQAMLDATVTGAYGRPRIDGTLRLDKGEFLDYGIGARLNDMAATFRFTDDTVRLVTLDGRAGPGTVSATGSLGLQPGRWPLDLRITARNARPLASDRLTVTLDGNLTLSGQIAGRLLASGAVDIRRAEIRIPETLPTSIAVLDVREPGAPQAPAAPPTPATEVALNLTLDAPREIFVRGRGMDAELGGRIRLRGTAANPLPDGGFEMRRGQFAIAGKTLTFRKGQVSFEGGHLADPTLNFVATTTSDGITAELGVAGTARKPKITLASTPELPQDEVLAYLLFGHGAATLGPMEMVRMASALASLTGVGPRIGDPLDLARQKLRLDRLALGGEGSSPTLEVGRYVAPGVYLGVKQGVTGTGTQATVQVDLTPQLKLEGTMGTGASPNPGTNAGASSVGILYQFEY